MKARNWLLRIFAMGLLPLFLIVPLSGCEMSCSSDADQSIEDTVDEVGDEIEDTAEELDDN